MRFVFALFVACVLLLSVTNGAAANAAVPCEPSPAEMLSHYDGDGDEVPSCPFAGGAHHHHSVAGEHQMAMPEVGDPLKAVPIGNSFVAISGDVLPRGQHPAFEPHPPKA